MKNNLDYWPKPCYNTYMTTKDAMTDTQTLALAYAEKLVEYYKAVNSDWSDKERAVREATNVMYAAQNSLAWAAEAEAKAML